MSRAAKPAQEPELRGPRATVRIRARLQGALRDLIVTGKLQGGAKLNERELAQLLRTSRTPLREALLHLEREGLVRSDLRRGFTVQLLSARDVRETYPVLAQLELHAVRTSARFVPALLPKLAKINADFARARSPARALDLDTLWHDTLMSRSTNARLAAMVSNLRLSIRRYEHLYMAESGLTAISVMQHKAIMAAFRRGDIEAALAALEENYRFGMQALLQKMGEE
jgi:DNA-binding GntR family transcriptional regulator